MLLQNSSNDPFVSVIVPIYKVEGTVEAAVKSIQAQTYQNLEIILVDDGSPDKSGEICDRLALEDKRIRVIHKQNGGVSSARNEGIIQATSDYLMFVDADDEIEVNAVETLINHQKLSGAELVIAGITEYYNKRIKNVCENDWDVVLAESTPEQIIGICSKNIMPFTPAKLFFKRVFTDNNLFFKEGLVCGEDNLLVFQYLSHIKKVSFVNKSLYRYYCFNSNGAARFFPLTGQIDIFRAKESFVRNNCSEEVSDEYRAKTALRNLIARFNYLAKRSIKNYDELLDAYNIYWPYIEPYVSKSEVFDENDGKWLKENLDYLTQKRMKPVYLNVKKTFKKKSKRRQNLNEFMEMPFKRKIVFIRKKLHI